MRGPHRPSERRRGGSLIVAITITSTPIAITTVAARRRRAHLREEVDVLLRLPAGSARAGPHPERVSGTYPPLPPTNSFSG